MQATPHHSPFYGDPYAPPSMAATFQILPSGPSSVADGPTPLSSVPLPPRPPFTSLPSVRQPAEPRTSWGPPVIPPVMQPIVPVPPPLAPQRSEDRSSQAPSATPSSFNTSAIKPALGLNINSEVLVISSEQRDATRAQRGTIGGNHAKANGDILHDLISASLVPLTEHLKDPDSIVEQATEFLGAFSEHRATWTVTVGNIPRLEGNIIYGLTPNSRDARPPARFLRFRFPYITFEWHIETPFYHLDKLTVDNSLDIKFMWKAWARRGAASGLVAYGRSQDTLVLTAEGYPVIQRRDFSVMSVFQSELMKPVPYLEKAPPLAEQNDLMIFSSSVSVIQSLRNSRKRLAFFVALSALFASIKPIVDHFNITAGWVFAGLGIVAALVSLISMFIEYLLEKVEANSAKLRQ